MADSQTGYVRLEEFAPPAPKELAKAIDKLRGKGAKQLIVDLRGNPGGDIEAMVAIAGSGFLRATDEVFHTQSRKRSSLDTVLTSENGEFAKLPLVLLIDAESASALRNAGRAHSRIMIGLLLSAAGAREGANPDSLPLPNGDVVWLTTARAVTPSGRVIQRRYAGLAARPVFGAVPVEDGAGDDTSTVYRTDAGRQVRGGGGVLADVAGPAPVELPVWFSVAVDSGYLAVADSVGELWDRTMQPSGPGYTIRSPGIPGWSSPSSGGSRTSSGFRLPREFRFVPGLGVSLPIGPL